MEHTMSHYLLSFTCQKGLKIPEMTLLRKLDKAITNGDMKSLMDLLKMNITFIYLTELLNVSITTLKQSLNCPMDIEIFKGSEKDAY